MIDIPHLIRTGEIKDIPKVTYSEYVVAAAKYYQENSEERMGQAYFNVLCVIRPDISEKIRGTNKSAFYNNKKLAEMLDEVYKQW